MCATWKYGRGPNSDVLIRRLNKCRTQTNDNVSHTVPDFEIVQSAIFSSIKFRKNIPTIISYRIATSALHMRTSSGDLCANDLMKEISKRELSYLRKKRREYVLRTTLSISGNLAFKNMRMLDSDIEFIPNSGKFEKLDDSSYRNTPFYGMIPTNYQPVIVKVTSRDPLEAGPLAIDRLDVLRGLWNFYLNPRWRMSFGGKRKPFNQVRLGPIHILHLPDGSLARNDGYWYEPNYVDPGKVLDLTKHKSELRKITFRDRSRLTRSPLREPTTEALVRYVRALDHWNWETAFLELWSVLEFLTDTAQQSYETTVKRAAFMYTDYESELAIAKHLRGRRNRAVHSGQTDRDTETLVFQLQEFVKALLAFYISNPFKLESKEEVGRFLDLPREAASLRRNLKLSKAAMQFRGIE